jgi:hypothetical protein
MKKNRYGLHTLHKSITIEQAVECIKIGFDFNINNEFTPSIGQILKGFEKDKNAKIAYFITQNCYKNWYGLLRVNGFEYSFNNKESAFDIQNEMLNQLIAIYKNQSKKNFTIYNYN